MEPAEPTPVRSKIDGLADVPEVLENLDARLERLETRIGAVERQSRLSHLLPKLAIAISCINPFLALVQYVYRAPRFSVVHKSDELAIQYTPATRELTLSFGMTLLNSGSRDCAVHAINGALTNSADPIESNLVPFQSGDFSFDSTSQQATDTVIVPKGDTVVEVRAHINYRVSDLGRLVLTKPDAKRLRIQLACDAQTLFLEYVPINLPKDFIDSPAEVTVKLNVR